MSDANVPPEINPAEKRATVTIWHFEDEGWVVAIKPVIGDREVDLDGRFTTPGDALNAACKWAIQRGLIATINGISFDVIKAGHVIGTVEQ